MATPKQRPRERVELTVESADVADEVVLAFRRDGELHELATLEPPAKLTLERS